MNNKINDRIIYGIIYGIIFLCILCIILVSVLSTGNKEWDWVLGIFSVVGIIASGVYLITENKKTAKVAPDQSGAADNNRIENYVRCILKKRGINDFPMYYGQENLRKTIRYDGYIQTVLNKLNNEGKISKKEKIDLEYKGVGLNEDPNTYVWPELESEPDFSICSLMPKMKYTEKKEEEKKKLQSSLYSGHFY